VLALPILLLFELPASLYPVPLFSDQPPLSLSRYPYRVPSVSLTATMAAETNNQGNAGEPLEKDFSNGTRYPPN
jgi:hypothetical protein